VFGRCPTMAVSPGRDGCSSPATLATRDLAAAVVVEIRSWGIACLQVAVPCAGYCGLIPFSETAGAGQLPERGGPFGPVPAERTMGIRRGYDADRSARAASAASAASNVG
jgi:hypothetical protein